MKIELHEITIREVAENYVDNNEEGVIGYNGKLNIRPKYQREFVYDEKKRNAVINTIRNNFPLNVMYWVENEDGTFEVLDGQQRTISFCQYINGDYSINHFAFHNLTKPEQEKILSYKLLIYFCEGDDQEKLDWFEIINIAGLELKEQERRNAVYTGPWLTHAKSIFSKNNCAASNLSKDYVEGTVNRQEILEKAIKWISKGEIRDYMSAHQKDPNADELWIYFQNVINWVKRIFTTYRSEMKGIDWGWLYDEYKDKVIDTVELEKKIESLMMDDEVQKKSGIYPYVLTNEEKYLNLRAFLDGQKRSAYTRQAGICPHCKKHFEIEQMEGDHITPWHLGGKTTPENCQMLCRECNRRKSGN